METYKGIAASPGIAIGQMFIYDQKLHIPNFSISQFQVEYEIDRFYNALRKAKENYITLQDKLLQEMSEDHGKILEAHILLCEDKTLIEDVVEKIRAEKKNIEIIIYKVIDSLSKKFMQMEDEYFRERAIDIYDFGQKVLQILLSQKKVSLTDVEEDIIVVSSELSVSDTASMNKKHVLGFVTEFGGKTSHSAILARSLAIPAILGVRDLSTFTSQSSICIIDGYTGLFIINPDKETLSLYHTKKEFYEEKERESLRLRTLSTLTVDGKLVPLKANLEIPEQELDSVKKYGAEGIGLYRSEFLYLSRTNKVLPSEEQQFRAYKYVLEEMSGKEVTIRTLDLGGDKVMENITIKEANPNLGWRAIRFCLSHPDIFKIQLRALYRASVYGNLKIMLPMVATIEEVLQTKALIDEVKVELLKKNIPFVKNVPLGIMVETPAAALLSGELAKIVDFFSIGSNDLIQYVIACDRGNDRLSYLYQPLHPAVLRMIKITIDNAHKQNIKVSLCGEMGSDVNNALILLGLGIDEISLPPVKLLDIRRTIRSYCYQDVKQLADKSLNVASHGEVIELINKFKDKVADNSEENKF